MKKSLQKIITLLLLSTSFFLHSQASYAAYTIDHLEPPFWWAGMKNQQLQLLLHGKDIADLSPSIDYSGLSIIKTTRVENPNYLFIDLELNANINPGTLTVHLSKMGTTQLTFTYPLLKRDKNSANRKGFDASDVIYLITPDRFSNANVLNDTVTGLREKLDRNNPSGRHGGDIQGMIKHLDYIANMGFTAIWSNPLTENNQPQYSYHGYSSTDLYKIDERFGTNKNFKQWVTKAREKGIGIIKDIVLNHIGSSHWWMNDLPTADWLNNHSPVKQYTNHARTTVQDPYASQQDHRHFVEGWFSDTMPDLNQSNKLLATYLIQNSIWWIEYSGLSGIREDTYSYANKHFLSQWANHIMAEYPNFTIVGEEWTTNPVIVSYWQKGKTNIDGYHGHAPSMMDFPLHTAMIEALTDEEKWGSGFVKMYEMLANDIVYPKPFNLVIFEGNHDTPRLFTQLNEDYDLYKMAMAYTLTMRGIPQIYYGSEILMLSPSVRDDGAVRADFPGGWPGDKINAFTGEGLSKQQKDAQNFLKKLLHWRKNSPVIHKGNLIHFFPQQGIYTYFRYNKKQKVMVVLNKNKHDTLLKTERFSEIINSETFGVDVISSKRYTLGKQMLVPARATLVLELQ